MVHGSPFDNCDFVNDSDSATSVAEDGRIDPAPDDEPRYGSAAVC